MFEKLTVRFPSEHPIFKYPSGQRSLRVRELVDFSLRLESILGSIDSRLARIEGMVIGSGTKIDKIPEQYNGDGDKGEEKRVMFDINAFTEI